MTYLISNAYILLIAGFVVGVLVYSTICYLFDICNFRNVLRNVVDKIF